MMMTQWRLARGEHRASARKVYRVFTLVLALGFAVLCGGATATAHPMPIRHVPASHQTTKTTASHAKLHKQASKARMSRESGRIASSKGAAVKNNHSTLKSAQRRADLPVSKPEARSRKRRHKRSAQNDNPDPPALHRASTSRPGGRPAGLIRHEIAARASEDEPLSSIPSASSEEANIDETSDAKHGTDAPVPSEAKSLTVDDFLRAASTAPASSIYASGESHPDENVSSSQLHTVSPTAKTLPTKRAAVLGRVEAAPAQNTILPIERAVPSDLAGAPLSVPEPTSRVAIGQNDLASTGLRAPSRHELIEEVEQPMVLPGMYRNGRLVVPPALRGTREILIHQNIMADDEGLQRVQDDYDLRRMRAARQLVDFSESASLHLNAELAGNRRCARPWAVRFASDMARAYYARFHQPLQVNSAVRTVAYQVRLRRVNGNAAGVDGDVASPHLTGEALDFGKRGMSMQEIAWMRTYLLPLMQSGKLDVEEEFQQSCFHISVYRAYLPATKRRPVGRSEVAQLREPRLTKIATHSVQDQ